MKKLNDLKVWVIEKLGGWDNLEVEDIKKDLAEARDNVLIQKNVAAEAWTKLAQVRMELSERVNQVSELKKELHELRKFNNYPDMKELLDMAHEQNRNQKLKIMSLRQENLNLSRNLGLVERRKDAMKIEIKGYIKNNDSVSSYDANQILDIINNR